ncbi:MAG: hypothetical protein IJA76_01075 [Clostridia bacterium]|nr:hypothetical protein [Clostridia bacterium]
MKNCGKLFAFGKKSLLNLNKALLGFAKQTDLNYSLFIIHYSLKKADRGRMKNEE